MAGEWGPAFSIRLERKEKITDMWSVEFAPSSLNDIAVHKAKIKSLEEVLERKLSGETPPFLLLLGPSGCGKATAVGLVAKKLEVSVHEWLNPIPFDKAFVHAEETKYYDVGDSQEIKFSEFLLRTNRYKELHFSAAVQSEKRIVVVKEFPNIFIKFPARFSDILKKYIALPKATPCIFIITDIEGIASLKKTLFPEDLIKDAKIDCIKFNPIASTAMLKTLQSVIKKASSHSNSRFIMPSREILEGIVNSSNGDMRMAINSLQFHCLKYTKKLQPTFFKSKDPSRDVGSTENTKLTGQHCLGARDATLSLFRILGKILHSKRLCQHNPVEDKLPPHLQHLKKNLLSFDPDVLFEKSCLGMDTYLSTLHHNYVRFCDEMEEVAHVSDYFSEVDFVMHDWSIRPSLISCQASVVTRGLAFFLNNSNKSGWKPLYKPTLSGVFSKILKTKEELLQHFFPLCKNCSKFAVEILPYFAGIPYIHLNSEQRDDAIRIGTFRSGIELRQERLEDCDLKFECELQRSVVRSRPFVVNDFCGENDYSTNDELHIEEVD